LAVTDYAVDAGDGGDLRIAVGHRPTEPLEASALVGMPPGGVKVVREDVEIG
jgi:hypothetical protein